MKKIYVLLSVILIQLIFVTGIYAKPVIKLVNPVIDLGTMTQHSTQRFMIVIKNEGDSDLKIEDVVVSCSCTTVDVGNKKVAPGKQTEVIAAFSSKNYLGDVSRLITIKSNDTKNPEARVMIKTHIVKEYYIEPEVIIFNDIVKNIGAKSTVRLWQKDKKALSIKELKYNDRILNISYAFTNSKNSELLLTINVLKGIKDDRFSEKVKVYFDDGKMFSFYVNGFIYEEDLKTSPPFIKIPSQKDNTSFILKTRSGKKFSIKKIHDLPKGVKVDYDRQSDFEYSVTVTLNRKKIKKGVTRADFIIESDYKDEEKKKISVMFEK